MITLNTDILNHLSFELEQTAVSPSLSFEPDQDTAMPADLRQWLVRLRMLEGVPFANLVADAALLPQESIRWFYLDRRWTDALVQGALSVSTLNSDDRIQLTAQYPAVRAELDTEEHNLRQRPGRERKTGPPGPISGFLLRSAAVSGWPGLHVRAFDVDPEEGDDARYTEDHPHRISLLRLERLAPAVLFCLFDGIPRVVHIEEPRQGIQFGFMYNKNRQTGEYQATLRPRRVSDFSYIAEDTTHDIQVPFRRDAPGVVDIRRLSRQLAQNSETGIGDELDSAEYALQLIRFPWRQVYGDVEIHAITEAFRPTLSYDLVAQATLNP